jgi:hypothetical protein
MDQAQVAEINAAIAKAEQGGDTDSANQLRNYLTQNSPAPASAADKQAIPSANYEPNLGNDESHLVPGLVGAGAGVFGGGKTVEAAGNKYLPQTDAVNTPTAVQKQFVSPADVEARINARPVAIPSVSVTGISDADLAARKTPGAPGSVNYGKVMAGQTMPDVVANQIQTMDKVNPQGAYQVAARDAANLEKIKAIGEGNQKLMNIGGTQLMLPESTTSQLSAEQKAAEQAAKQKLIAEQSTHAKDAAKLRLERLTEVEALKGKFGPQVAAKVAELKKMAEVPMKYVGKLGEAAHTLTGSPLAAAGLRAVAGYGAGKSASEAAERFGKDQNIRGVVSGLGAVGDLAAMSRNPYGMVLGGAASVGAPLLNQYLDKLAEEHPEMAERIGLADGGSVHTGGITKDELEFIHHLRALHAKKSKQ